MSAGAASGGITTMNEFEGEGVVEGREVERVSVESSETDDDGSRQKMLARRRSRRLGDDKLT